MKQSNMSPSQLKRQKFAGYVLPMLLGWFLFSGVLAATIWFEESIYFSDKSWFGIVIIFYWLTLVPVGGQIMGIVNAFCWQHQQWVDGGETLDDKEFNSQLALSLSFWLLTFIILSVVLPLDLGIYWFLAIWLFVPHFKLFRNGQRRGKNWIRTGAINQFLGRTSEWERNKPE